MALNKRELLAGPFDGEWLIVPDGQETILRLDGHCLHRYDIDEVYEGVGVRPVYRHAAQVPCPPDIREKMLKRQQEDTQ
jgi:hypothetical protein